MAGILGGERRDMDPEGLVGRQQLGVVRGYPSNWEGV